jgi:peptidoglycan hydrolase CwlO-like protein
VEQIASKQEQMAQDIATLQAAERDVNQKISALTTATAVRAARKNVPKTVYPEPAGQPASAPLPVSRPPAGTPAPAQ